MVEEQANKKHYKSTNNPANKAKKKEASGLNHNPKAFISASGRRAAKTNQRTADRLQNKLHKPILNRSSFLNGEHATTVKGSSSIAAATTATYIPPPPPMTVAVVGPAGVGKSTLIRSLVKRYSRQNINGAIKGPITCVAAKKQRITLLECNNSLTTMIDVSKVADLVLLLVDARQGFSMETFEFLNLLQTHGFPRVIGILTHLDSIKENKKLKAEKKKLKQRFWTELHQGAKLFYLTGLLHSKYLDREVMNLSRFIAVTKTRPLSWRANHPYLIADRVEDITPHDSMLSQQERDIQDRTIVLHGWVRGSNFRNGNQIHIPGAGDFELAELKVLEDPCPLPNQQTIEESTSAVGMVNSTKKKRRPTLNDKNRLVYAPMSDVSSQITYDEESIYIEVKKSRTTGRAGGADEEEEEGDILMRSLKAGGDVKGSDSDDDGLLLFGDGTKVYGDSGSEVGSEDESASASASASEDDDDQKKTQFFEDDFGGFRKVKENTLGEGKYDSFAFSSDSDSDSDSESYLHSLRSKFITAPNTEDGGYKDLEKNDDDSDSDDDDGDDDDDNKDNNKDEDLKRKDELKRRFDKEFDSRSSNRKESHGAGGGAGGPTSANANEKDLMMLEKERMKEQVLQNYLEFSDILQRGDHQTHKDLIGVCPGSYVRMVIKGMPCEFVQNRRKEDPVIVGGLLAGESALGMLQCRIKKHRWHPRILKNDEPIIVSVGWRRYQTIPLLYMRDAGTRNRQVKYTPEHLHCMATFWGAVVPPGTGFLAFRHLGSGQSGFRVAATGTILEYDHTVSIQKKLKLIGSPYEIKKNTAFIKGMFTSDLEVTKFEGASIKTVSGIRGQVKKALSSPPGAFRASFEDKVLKSDIVFMRTWFPVTPRRLYNPIYSHLVAASGSGGVDGVEDNNNNNNDNDNNNNNNNNNDKESLLMKLNVELRSINNLPTPRGSEDSQYEKDGGIDPLERENRKFAPLRIPTSLQKELPFASKPKFQPPTQKKKKGGYMANRAVILEKDERSKLTTIQQLTTMKRDKDRKRDVKQKMARQAYLKRKGEEDRIQEEKHRARIQKILQTQRKKRENNSK